MHPRRGEATRAGEALWYLAAAVLASLAAFVSMQLWRADLHVPFSYSWDAVSALSGTKGMLENGWFFRNAHLGAPGVQVLYDYPSSEFFNLLALKIIGLFAKDAALIVNVYFLLGFPLVAITAFGVGRELGISRAASLLVAVIYAVMPYHFLRGEQHLFLSFYVMVPPAVLLAVLAMRSDERIAVFRTSPPGESIVWWRRFAPVFLCVVIGAAGVYYALFTAFLIAVAGVVAGVRCRRIRAGLPALVLIFVIALTMAVNIAPTVAYQMHEGRNQTAVKRDRWEAQVYGLRIDGLILPAQGHRIPGLAEFQREYFAWLGDSSSAVSKENASEALGLIGAIGFLVLLVVLLLRAELVDPHVKGPAAVLGDSSVLTGALVLMATTAGLGATFSFAVPLIRAYNRASIFVALFALLAVGALFDRVWAPDKRRTLRIAVVLGILLFAVFDQTTPTFIPDYEGIARNYKADAEFVSEVEGSLQPASMVFQLPYVPYPESPFVNKMVDYDHLKPYLHSRSTRWSYGAVKGRKTDLWQQRVSSRNVPGMLSQLRAAGFSGLLIDRFGYADEGRTLEKQVSATLKVKGVQSQSGRYVFFKLQ